MEAWTTEPYFPWPKKAESVIKIIKEKAKRRRFHKNIPKSVWDFGMAWEADIYSRTAGKDWHTALKHLTRDIIDTSECLEFDFYDLVWF